MRIVSRDLVFGFIGTVGLVGTAAARPDVARPSQERVGTPPAHFMRSDVMLHAMEDGRGETQMAARAARDAAFNTPSAAVDRSSLDPVRTPALPFKADLRNRIEAHDGAATKGLHVETTAARHHDAPNTFAAPSQQAPLPIKSDVALKLAGGGEGSLVSPVARPDSARRKLDKDQDPRSLCGDASQADLRSTKTYPGRHEDVLTPASMFMKGSINAHRHGDSAGDKDEL